MDNSEKGHDADDKSADNEAPAPEKPLRKRGVLAVGLLVVAWIGMGVYLWPVLRDPQHLAMASSSREGGGAGWDGGSDRVTLGDVPAESVQGGIGARLLSLSRTLSESSATPADFPSPGASHGVVLSSAASPDSAVHAVPSAVSTSASSAPETLSVSDSATDVEAGAGASPVFTPISIAPLPPPVAPLPNIVTGTAPPLPSAARTTAAVPTPAAKPVPGWVSSSATQPVASTQHAEPGVDTNVSTPTQAGSSTPQPTLLVALERKTDKTADDGNRSVLYEEHFSDDAELSQHPSDTPPPSPRSPAEMRGHRQGWAQVAVIIDDLGYNGPVSEGIARLPADLTLAILPGGGHSRAVANLGKATNKEIILHQPMEPRGYPHLNPGRGALLMGMDRERTRRILEANLNQFPEARGVNNHMGSRFTADSVGMGRVMEVLAERGLFFVDSRTAGRSVGVREAVVHHVPRVQRDIFLDNVPNVRAINQQLARLEAVAHRHGSAVAIGHPYPATLAALRSWLPEAKSRRIEVIRASQLLGPASSRARYPTRTPVVAQAH
ncbi:MAG: divergent polysaccharide deacetylase family protein [Magnetococcales bacterium]|nr:divergent polysaccharide deacetylase family protein [Magnetococcales bacterium]